MDADIHDAVEQAITRGLIKGKGKIKQPHYRP
jgi:hypothetical protein